VSFIDRALFIDTKFHGILVLDNANIRLIDKLQVKGVSLDGAIIEEANFWRVKRLEGYSFKDSFLLSISFADREIIDCDFTGALFDAVHTRGWKPDDLTIKKTKYIYTDYESDEATGKLKVIEDSRVPASGNFGEGENKGFDITDFLKDRFKWSRSISVPIHLRTAVQNYIKFFEDFMKISEGIDVEVHTKIEGERLRVEFLTETRKDKESIEGYFQEYLKKANETNVEKLDIKFNERSTASKIVKDKLIIDLKNQIRNFQTQLSYTEKLLESEIEKKNLLIEFKESLKKPQALFESKPTERTDYLFVLKADIVGFSKFMEDGNRGKELSKKLRELTNHHAKNCIHKEVTAGDSVVIINKEPVELIIAINRIKEDLDRINGSPKLRTAIDFGLLDYKEIEKGIEPETSNILRNVARIEP